MLGGRYRLDERIGAGGMGEVWRATDTVLDRPVAVKVVLPALVAEPGFVRRFLAEARAMASVHHPNVVAIHDFHGDGAGAYLVMELVGGESLAHLLARVGRLRPEHAMSLLAQAAAAVQAVHERGIVHRDIKPADLLVRADGSLALTDFGIAAAPDRTSLTTPGAILGTPSYLAPEQVMGQPASVRSDVYALGLVAYECVTGQRPFTGDNPYAVAISRVNQPPPSLDGLAPPPVAAVVARALATDPAQRWPSAADLAGAARQAGGLAPAVGVPTGAPTVVVTRPGPASGRRRSWWLWLTVGVLVLAAGVGGALAWHPWSRPGTATPEPTGVIAALADPGPHGMPAGLVRCAQALCPAAPMCWAGLNQIGNTLLEPRPLPCTEPHYWETFTVGFLPAGATAGRPPDTLMERPDLATYCSADVLAARSVSAGQTQGWRRDAVPIRAADGTQLVHCLAGSTDGETTGSVFATG